MADHDTYGLLWCAGPRHLRSAIELRMSFRAIRNGNFALVSGVAVMGHMTAPCQPARRATAVAEAR